MGSMGSHDDNSNLVPRVLSYPSLRSETGRRENLETRLRQQEAALLSSLRVRVGIAIRRTVSATLWICSRSFQV